MKRWPRTVMWRRSFHFCEHWDETRPLLSNITLWVGSCFTRCALNTLNINLRRTSSLPAHDDEERTRSRIKTTTSVIRSWWVTYSYSNSAMLKQRYVFHTVGAVSVCMMVRVKWSGVWGWWKHTLLRAKCALFTQPALPYSGMLYSTNTHTEFAAVPVGPRAPDRSTLWHAAPVSVWGDATGLSDGSRNKTRSPLEVGVETIARECKINRCWRLRVLQQDDAREEKNDHNKHTVASRIYTGGRRMRNKPVHGPGWVGFSLKGLQKDWRSGRGREGGSCTRSPRFCQLCLLLCFFCSSLLPSELVPAVRLQGVSQSSGDSSVNPCRSAGWNLHRLVLGVLTELERGTKPGLVLFFFYPRCHSVKKKKTSFPSMFPPCPGVFLKLRKNHKSPINTATFWCNEAQKRCKTP